MPGGPSRGLVPPLMTKTDPVVSSTPDVPLVLNEGTYPTRRNGTVTQARSVPLMGRGARRVSGLRSR
jgi:hypothetical protein